MIAWVAAAAAADDLELGVLPALGYSSDTGISLGVAAVLARLDPGTPPYAWRVSGQLAASLEPIGTGVEIPLFDNYLRVERAGLFDGRLRLRGEVTFVRQNDAGWYGLGNASPAGAPEDVDWRYTRTSPTARAEAWWDLAPPLRLFGGGGAWLSRMEVDPESRLAADAAGASGDLVGAALVGVDDHGAGELFGGVMLDTRDDEVWPTRGQFHDVGARAGVVVGEGAGWLGADAAARVWVPLGTPRAVLAGQLLGDALWGAPPFYELARHGGVAPAFGPGGQYGPRGVPLQRYHGAGKALASLEVRTMVWGFPLFGLGWELGPVAFADAGRVWARMASTPELDGEGAGLHVGAGGGLRLRMGESTVVRADFAWSPEGRGTYLDLGNVF